MIFRSLRANLNLGLLVSLVLLLIILWALSGVAIKSVIRDYIESRLEHDAETLLVASQVAADGTLSLDERQIQNIYRRPFSGHYFAIQGPAQTHYSRSLWDEQLTIPPPPESGEVRVVHQPGPQQQMLLVRSQAYEKQGLNLVIVTAEDVSHIADQIRQLQQRLGILILFIVIILMGIQSLLIHMGMRPVRQARQAVDKLETGEANTLPETFPSEVLPLVREVNRLLQHQQQRLQRSRHALGDVAHALKTPLALIQQWYENLPGDEQERHASVTRHVQQIRQRIDSELRRARMAGDQRGNARFSLESDLPDLLDTLQRLHHEKHISLETGITTEPRLPIEREDGMELLGNLLDNAWKWAKQHIRLTIESRDKHLHIILEDDGPGIDEQRADDLIQRGQRQDETVSGHGIGLSIVREVVHSYKGSLQLQRSEQLGGLRAIVQLPLFVETDQ